MEKLDGSSVQSLQVSTSRQLRKIWLEETLSRQQCTCIVLSGRVPKTTLSLVTHGRLVVGLLESWRPLAGQMTGTHVFPLWRMLVLVFVCLYVRMRIVAHCSFKSKKEKINRRDEMATWLALSVVSQWPRYRSSPFASWRFLTFPFRSFSSLFLSFRSFSDYFFFFFISLTWFLPLPAMCWRWKLHLPSCRTRCVNP